MTSNTAATRQGLISAYLQQFPMEAASTLDALPSDKVLVYLQGIPADHTRVIFSRLNPDTATRVIKQMEDRLFTQVFSGINTHLGARLLSRLPEKEISHKLSLLPGVISREMQDFMSYQHDSAGYLMDTAVTAFYDTNRVEDVLEGIRKIENRVITSVYVIDEAGILLGEVPLQVIVVSQSSEKLGALMERVQPMNANASREEVVQTLERENMLQIPVTDINNHLLGVIRTDELINATKQEVTENLQSMFGAGKEEQALSKISFAVKKRLPWLQVNLATAFLASFVVGLFEDTIAKITILAVFLPVVAGQSGNTGSQALAVTMRGLALREIRISQWWQVAQKEIMVGLINGVAVAFTTGTIVFFWSGSFGIAVVIAVSMVLSMMIAGFSGAGIPMALKALGQDPATSSSIILTTVTDICGFLSFLGLATALSSVLGII